MGVEPTHERAGAHATVLKTARPTYMNVRQCRSIIFFGDCLRRCLRMFIVK